jgi:lysophospholipase L1-like esterase
MLKNLALLFGSSIITVVLFVAGYEWYAGYQYDLWHKYYGNHGNWIDGIMVPSENPVLMWEMRPNHTCSKEQCTGIQTNRFGFRDKKDITLKPAKNVERIAFVGDSVALGYGTENAEDIFISQFEKMANELLSNSNLNLEALNFGVAGYNTPQIREQLSETVLAYEPKYVVYALCLNDFDLEDASSALIRYFKKPDSFFMEKFYRAYRKVVKIDYFHFYFKKNHELIFQEILAMRDLLSKKGIKFHVVILPVYLLSARDFSRYPYVDIHDEIERWLSEQGISYTDILPHFVKLKIRPSELSYDLYHPTPLGHREIAQASVQTILDDFQLREAHLLEEQSSEIVAEKNSASVGGH